MSTLLGAELLAHRGRWAWILLVVVVGVACSSGVLISIATALEAAESAPDPEAHEALQTLGANVIAWTVAAAAGVIGATSALVMESQAREHSLWIVLGAPRTRVGAVLARQLAVLGGVGGVLGWPLAMLVAAVAGRQWTWLGLAPAGLAPGPAWWHPFAAVGLGVLACLWGGWGAVRRAARVPETAALREADAPRSRVGLLKLLAAVHLGIAGVGLLVTTLAGGFDGHGGPEVGGAVIVAAWVCLVAATLLVGSWTLRPVLLAWTALVPDRDPAWHVARESCRQRSLQSVTTVLPFALALSLLGVLLGAGSVPGGQIGSGEMIVLLGWVLLVSWVGGIAVLALVGRQRNRDGVVLAIAGADRGVRTRLVLFEGCAYAVTAIVVGLLFLGGSVASTAVAAQVPLATAVARCPWGLFAAAAAATLATTCLTVFLSARTAIRSPSLELLRT